MLASVSFLGKTRGFELSRAALTEANVALAALNDLLTALAVDPRRVEIESDVHSLSPEVEQLLVSSVEALELLKFRTKDNLRNVEKINEYEVCLAKKKEQTQRDIQEVAEEIVTAKLRDVELRSELAELNHEYSKTLRQLESSRG